jgi:uncharacterized membrane protein
MGGATRRQLTPMSTTLRAPGLTPPLAPAAAPPAARRAAGRLEAIDRLRGLVIVIMMLDHVREFFAYDALRFEATDLARTSPALFATRWITHLCAPTFVFLAGASVFLQRAAERDDARDGRARLSRFLLTRGLWLVLVEVTIVGLSLDLAPFLLLEVIWAIGAGMIAFAALVWAPPRAVLALGAAIVVGHQALLPPPAMGSALAPLRSLFLAPGPLAPLAPGFAAYPAIPWLGVMCLGYGLAPVFTWAPERRRRALLLGGAAAVAAFLVLRAVNGYGDPSPWARQGSDAFTALSFLKVTKQPPSLDFVLVTLGLSLPLGVAVERLRGAAARLLLAFGRVPLFAFVVHLYLAHLLAAAVGAATGVPASAFVRSISDPTRLRDAGWGFGLAAVYAWWALVVLAMWPLAAWYAEAKRRRPRWWMRYL